MTTTIEHAPHCQQPAYEWQVLIWPAAKAERGRCLSCGAIGIRRRNGQVTYSPIPTDQATVHFTRGHLADCPHIPGEQAASVHVRGRRLCADCGGEISVRRGSGRNKRHGVAA